MSRPGASIGADTSSPRQLLIIPTVPVPPTSVSEAYGLQPGPAVAGDANTSTGIFPGFAVGARYRQNVDGRSSDPTIAVEIQPPALGQVGTTFGLRVQYAPPIGGGLAAPYADSGVLSLIPTFERWPFADAEIQATPLAADGTMATTGWQVVAQPQLVTLADNSILCLFIARELSTGHFDVVVKRFQSATDFSWMDWCTLASGSGFSFQALSGDADVQLTGIAAVVAGAQVYVWLSGNRGSPETHGIYYQFRLLGQTFSTTAIVRAELAVGTFCDGITVIGGPTPTALVLDGRTGSPPTARAPIFADLATGGDNYPLATVSEITIATGTSSPVTNSIGLLLQAAAAKAGVTRRPNGTAIGLTSFQYFTDLAFPPSVGGNMGVALKSTGQRFVTADGGQSWAEKVVLTLPVFLTATAVAVDQLTPTSPLAACIVGEAGYISVSLDALGDPSGWTTPVTAPGNSANFSAVAISVSQHPTTSAQITKIWVSGDQGLWYSGDAGVTWTQIAYWAGAYNDLITDGTAVLGVGAVGVHGRLTGTLVAQNTTRAALFKAANTETDGSANVSFWCPPSTTDAAQLVGVAAAVDGVFSLTNLDTLCYAVSRTGQLWRFTGNSASGTSGDFSVATAMDAIAGTIQPGALAVDPQGEAQVIVVGQTLGGKATLWANTSGISALTAGPGQLLMTAERLPVLPLAVAHPAVAGTALHQFIIAGTDSTIMIRSPVFSQRARPWAYQLPGTNGQVMAIANLTLNLIELYRADQIGIFQYVAQGPTFASVGLDLTPVPRATFAVSNLGELLVTVGESGLVSLDWGRSWLQPNDPSLPLPVGHMPLAGDAVYPDSHIISTRSSMGLNDGRLMSVVVGAAHGALGDLQTIGTFLAREWIRSTGADSNGNPISDQTALALSPRLYAPVMATGGWHLLDALRLVIPGSPEPGDTWSFAPNYVFPPSNFAQESPSQFYRGQDHDQTQLTPPALPGIDLMWDRLDPNVQAVLGPGRFWNVCAFSLIGTNFAVVEFAISAPGDDSQWITKQVSAAVQTGFAAAISADSQCVLRDPLLAGGGDATHLPMIPSQYAPGYRRFTLAVALQQADEGGSVHVYDIVDNTESDFILATADGAAIPPDAAAAYAVISDRLAWLGDAPDMRPAAAAGITELNGTPWRFGRYLRVRILSQPTADGYFRIGSQVMGTFYDGFQAFAPGPTFQATTNTREEQALTGNSAVEFFGQGQHWQLSFTALTRDMATALYSMLTRDQRLRQAIMWIRERNDPTSGELIRFDDAPPLVGIAEVAGDWCTLTWAAKEVL